MREQREKQQMKISILVFDLSNNCLVRTYPIAKVLERRYSVEIIGPVFGRDIFPPYANEFDYKSVEGRNYPFFISSAKEILGKIEGDVIYAFKPRPTSYGIGLLKKLFSHLPVILDIEDWEVGLHLQHNKLNLLKSSLPIWRPNAFLYTLATEPTTRFADEITVVSNLLQKKFGGVKLPHGANTDIFDPDKYDRVKLREKWGIGGEKIILFSGTPHPYKGLEDILNALDRIKEKNIKLMLVGTDRNNPYVQKIIRKWGNKVIIVGHRQHSEMPNFLSISDLIVLPQRKTLGTMAQVPGKIFEAMSMGKPIIATNVSDLPEILDGCGLIIEPKNTKQLAEKIEYLLDNEDVAKKLGKKARGKCIRKYSWDAMEGILKNVFDRYEK